MVRCSFGPGERKEPNVADVNVYVNRPAEKGGTALEDIEAALESLDCVSNVEVDSPGNVVAVSYEGGKSEREEIKNAVEAAGYEVSRLSVRADFPEEGKIWDI